MKIGDLQTGDWFELLASGERFIKVDPFLHGKVTYNAVSLLDGRLSFPMRTSTADPSPLWSEEELVARISKPDWSWRLKIDQ